MTLTAVYIFFGEVCYIAWGANLTQPIVTEMLPTSNFLVPVFKILFCFNLVFSYPICINPTNTILESYLFRSWKKKSTARTWLKNLSRALVVIAAVYMAVELADKIDKVLGLLGAVCCAPLALTIPALMHQKLLAKTRAQKAENVFYITLSLGILFFSTYQSLANWNVASTGH